MFDLNLDEIEDVSGGIAPGTHVLTVVKAELKETKARTGTYIKVEFKAENNQRHWENYNITNPNEQAQKIGRGQIKAFLKAAGYTEARFDDVNKMLGLKVKAKIKATKDTGYGEGRAITSYASVGDAEVKGADPFV